MIELPGTDEPCIIRMINIPLVRIPPLPLFHIREDIVDKGSELSHAHHHAVDPFSQSSKTSISFVHSIEIPSSSRLPVTSPDFPTAEPPIQSRFSLSSHGNDGERCRHARLRAVRS